MKSLAAILVLLAVAGCSTDSRAPAHPPPAHPPEPVSAAYPDYLGTNSQSEGFAPVGAVVRSLHGDVQYGNGISWQPVRVNLMIPGGSRIRTGPGSDAYLSLAGTSATVKLTADSDVELASMMLRSQPGGNATRIALELHQGALLGSVKKLSAESAFQVRGGGVTMKLREGDFQMSAEGRVEAVRGAITVQAGEKTYQLQTGKYFDAKKDEVGKVPGEFLTGTFVIMPVSPSAPSAWPGSSSLSPFERGLENARHGLPGF
jgi:hypothetical protein